MDDMDEATGTAFAAWLEEYDASIASMSKRELELLRQALARAYATGDPKAAGEWLASQLGAEPADG
jgi:hypothetical protein